jgi:hypothetical protein
MISTLTDELGNWYFLATPQMVIAFGWRGEFQVGPFGSEKEALRVARNEQMEAITIIAKKKELGGVRQQ